ncbi:MAG: HDOD domain-containing protein [Planctomycetes bacterium]|nr:HDOD domain-containing protein [Planctomycetota bacterium]
MSSVHSNQSRRVEIILQQLDSLPTLSSIAIKLLDIVSSQDSDFSDIIELISCDPALCAKVLKICRCMNGGRARQITNIKGAVTMTGFDAVRSAVLSVQVFEAFDSIESAGGEQTPTELVFEREMFWRHSVAVAVASEWLAGMTKGPNKVERGEAYVCGLLHDLGLLAMHVLMPRSFDRACELAESKAISLDSACNRVIGIDGRVAGKRLAQHWQLPQIIVDAMWLHGQPFDALPKLPHQNLIALVTLADALVRQRYIAPVGHAPQGEDLRTLAEQFELKSEHLNRVASRLHDEVAQRAIAIGLGEEPTTQSLLRSISRANDVLGNMATTMRAQANEAQFQTKTLIAITQFHNSSAMESVENVLVAIAKSIGPVIKQSPIAAIYHSCNDDVWELLQFNDEGCIVAREILTPPVSAKPLTDFANLTGHSLLLADFAPWFDVSLLSGVNVDQIYIIPLATVGASAGVALLHNQPIALHEKCCGIDAMFSAFSAAIDGVAQQEQSRRLAEDLVEAYRTLSETREIAAKTQAMAALGEIAAGAAHEMNNPLAVISGRSQLLAQKLKDGELKSAALQIAERSHELSEMITALQSMAKPIYPNKESVNIANLVQEKVDNLGPRNSASSKIKLVVDAELPSIHLDPKQISLALGELIRNAFEAAPDTQIQVNVQIDPLDNRLKIQVTDSGPGFSDDALAHAFVPFFSDKPAGRQQGLGLARARRLVLANRGQITLENGSNGGATATIWLSASQENKRSYKGAA